MSVPFRVIEVRAKDAVIVSEEFGSCLDPKKTRLYGDAVRELRARQQTTQIFTVRGGRITMREEVRRWSRGDGVPPPPDT